MQQSNEFLQMVLAWSLDQQQRRMHIIYTAAHTLGAGVNYHELMQTVMDSEEYVMYFEKPASLIDTVRRLVRHGYIRRHTDDGIYITPKGYVDWYNMVIIRVTRS